MESKPRKQFRLKTAAPASAEAVEAVEAVEATKVRKTFNLKAKEPALPLEAEAPAKPTKTVKKFTIRKKKERCAMTEAEELAEDVREWYLTHGVGQVPEEDRAFLEAMVAEKAAEAPVYEVPADAALAWQLMMDYPNFWHPDFVAPADPRFAQLEAIQKGMPAPPPLTEEQKEAIEDSVPPPHGTKEFWIWIAKRKARANAERAAQGLPPLPTKKEKEAAAAKKKAEKEAAAAAKAKKK